MRALASGSRLVGRSPSPAGPRTFLSRAACARGGASGGPGARRQGLSHGIKIITIMKVSSIQFLEHLYEWCFHICGNVATCQLGARFGGEFRGFGKQGFWVTASSSARNQAPLPLPPDGRGPRAPGVADGLQAGVPASAPNERQPRRAAVHRPRPPCGLDTCRCYRGTDGHARAAREGAAVSAP